MNPINLNHMRKAKAKADAKTKADGNAVRFGRTKVEKALEQARVARQETRLSEHKRDQK